MKLKRNTVLLLVILALAIVALLIFGIVYLYRYTRTEFYLDDDKVYSIPIPEGSKYMDWGGLDIKAFKTKKSVEEITQYYKDYISDLPLVVNAENAELTGHYDKSRNIVFLGCDASIVEDKTLFRVSYNKYAENIWITE